MKDIIVENIDIWSPEIIILLIVTGFLVGVINTLAGSGTAISYAVFMLLGLPPSYANGTVRIGVITQTLAASINFYSKKMFEIRKAFFIAVPITLGSITGAEIAVNIDKDIFRLIIGGAMIVMLFFIFYKPERWVKGKKITPESIINKWFNLN